MIGCRASSESTRAADVLRDLVPLCPLRTRGRLRFGLPTKGSRVARDDPRPGVHRTQHYGMFPIILFASSMVKPRKVSLRTLPSEPALSSVVVTASSVPSTMDTAS